MNIGSMYVAQTLCPSFVPVLGVDLVSQEEHDGDCAAVIDSLVG